MTRYGFEYSGKVDRDTSSIAVRKQIEAENEEEALKALAKDIWEEAGWGSEKECLSHLFENFSAYEE